MVTTYLNNLLRAVNKTEASLVNFVETLVPGGTKYIHLQMMLLTAV